MMIIFSKQNIKLIYKYYKLSILSIALFLFFIFSNIGLLIDSFNYNPDIFTNKIVLFAVIFSSLFILHLYEIIKRILLHIKQETDSKNISFILETTGDVLYHLVLPERKYSFLSPAITDLIGYSKEELNSIGIKSLVKKVELLDRKNITYSEFNLKNIGDDSAVFSAEYLIKTRDGKYKWIEDVSVASKSKTGTITGTVGILRDITKRKNYFSLINEELNNIKKYLEIAEVIFLVFDKNQSITYANMKASQVLGYSEVDLIGKNWYDYFTPVKNREKRKKGFSDIFLGIQPVEEYQENIIMDRYGDEHIVGWRDAVIRDNRNNITAFISSGIDITEQKKIEESLRYERYLLQILMDNIPDGIFFKDKESKYIRAGKGLGLKDPDQSSVSGKTDFAFFAREYAQNSLREEQDIIASGIPVINKIEKQVFLSGTQKWVSTTKVPVYDAENKISGIVGISRDISELKKAEDKIKENEHRWRYLLENSPICIAIISKGTILYANSEAMNIVGAESPEQVLGKRIYDFIPAEFLHNFFLLNKALRNQEDFKIPHTEGRLYKLNREIVEVEGAAIPVNHMGKDAVQVIFKDISERKNQEKLRQIIYEILQTANSEVNIEHLYKFIHNSVKSLMKAENFYIALYDHETDLISLPYHTDKFDSPPLPFKPGKSLTAKVLTDGKPLLITRDAFQKLEVSGEMESMGTACKIWLGVPLKIQDKSIGVMVVQDYENEFTYGLKELLILETIAFPVSRAIERKMVETERETLINQLREINLSKDRLFSVISHDLRSPFNALLGLSGILANDYDSLSDKDRSSYLNYINQTSRNLYALVNNLLEFSRFQTGKVQFNPKNIKYSDIVRKSISLLEGNAVSKKIAIIDNLEEAEIFADEAMLNSIIQNLLSNAIKFTEPGGKVEISGQVFADNKRKEIELRIKDQGVGMNKELSQNLLTTDKIFSTIGTSKEPGSGLGLLITRDYVEKNKGTISVTSEPGVGTEFVVTLPLAQ